MAFRLGLLAFLFITPQTVEGSRDPYPWKEFLDIPSNNSAREHLRQLTMHPHLAGTAGDFATFEYVYSQFQSFGLETLNSSFDVYLPFPLKASLKGLPPSQYQAVLHEDVFSEVQLCLCFLSNSTGPKYFRSPRHSHVQWLLALWHSEGRDHLCQLWHRGGFCTAYHFQCQRSGKNCSCSLRRNLPRR